MAIWEGLRTPPKCQFLKYPALKGRVSAGGRIKNQTKNFRRQTLSEFQSRAWLDKNGGAQSLQGDRR